MVVIKVLNLSKIIHRHQILSLRKRILKSQDDDDWTQQSPNITQNQTLMCEHQKLYSRRATKLTTVFITYNKLDILHEYYSIQKYLLHNREKIIPTLY